MPVLAASGDLPVELARLVLTLGAFGVITQLAMLAWVDRTTDRTLAQLALIVSLALIVVDTIIRVERDDPFVPHLYVFRAAVVLLAGVYAVKRLAARR